MHARMRVLSQCTLDCVLQLNVHRGHASCMSYTATARSVQRTCTDKSTAYLAIRAAQWSTTKLLRCGPGSAGQMAHDAQADVAPQSDLRLHVHAVVRDVVHICVPPILTVQLTVYTLLRVMLAAI